MLTILNVNHFNTNQLEYINPQMFLWIKVRRQTFCEKTLGHVSQSFGNRILDKIFSSKKCSFVQKTVNRVYLHRLDLDKGKRLSQMKKIV